MGLLKLFTSLLSPKQQTLDLTDEPYVAPRWIAPKRPPDRKGKRKTEDELELEHRSLVEHMTRTGAKRVADEIRRAKKVNATQYIWRSCRDGGVCAICAANDGKRFKFAVRPAHGHPGEAACEGYGFCRCYMEIVLPPL